MNVSGKTHFGLRKGTGTEEEIGIWECSVKVVYSMKFLMEEAMEVIYEGVKIGSYQLLDVRYADDSGNGGK